MRMLTSSSPRWRKATMTVLGRVSSSSSGRRSIAVRLTARLKSRRTLNGPQVKRVAPAGSVLRLRLRLPTKPAGTVKTAWITGRVRNFAGDVRTVKLPVRLPR